MITNNNNNSLINADNMQNGC